VLYPGDCLKLLAAIPDESLSLVITSPPYNIGKEYEKKLKLETYIEQQAAVIRECVRCLSPQGSICWQVGNYVDGGGGIIPLDTVLYPIFTEAGLKMRNRIIWHFEHGLHCSRRFSGRYETVIWFTKTDKYTFSLDPVRVPQKYPGKKYFKTYSHLNGLEFLMVHEPALWTEIQDVIAAVDAEVCKTSLRSICEASCLLCR